MLEMLQVDSFPMTPPSRAGATMQRLQRLLRAESKHYPCADLAAQQDYARAGARD